MKRFFFATEVPWALALIRIGIGIVVLGDLLPRSSHALELYSSVGLPMPFPLWSEQGPFVPALPPEWAITLHAAAVFFALAATAGWQTRASLVGLTGLYLYFALLDLPGTMTKYTILSAHVLLLLIPSQCGAVLSLDAILRRRGSDAEPVRAAIWPRRLIQMLVVAVYLGGAVTKLRMPGVLEGQWLAQSLLNEDAGRHPLGQSITLWPPLLVLMSYGTVFFQMLFPFLVWVRPLRFWMLGIGALFHLSHGPTLNIWIFPLLVVTCYAAFLGERDLRRLGSRLRRIAGKLLGLRSTGTSERAAAALRPAHPAVPVTAFVVALIAFEVAAGAYQRRMDSTGWLRGERPRSLEPISDEARAQLFDEVLLEPQDYFLFVDVGSWGNKDRSLNSVRRCRPGRELVAYAELLEPHPRLIFGWNLLDTDGRPVVEESRFVTAQIARDLCRIRLDRTLPPGLYELVLRCAGREVFRRRLTVAPN